MGSGALPCVSLLVLVVVLVSAASPLLPETYIVPPAHLAEAPYADWAHKHWVWHDAGYANQTTLLALVHDYLAHDIPVACVNVDSSWQAKYNDFLFNEQRYPSPKTMIDEFHSLGVKVIVWATSMVNKDAPTFDEAKNNKYFLEFGKTVKWWHGTGAFIDYWNPEALKWWHGQLDKVLDLGIDGWKCDGTDPYTLEFIVPISHKGPLWPHEYGHAYYSDFFDYTRQKRGKDTLIMARPVDSYKSLFFWSFAPQRVITSGWVGDQDPTFDGFAAAMKNMIHSSWRGYACFGSDIGGYRSSGGPKPLGRTKELFTRWYQQGAFVPLMENGGNNEHRPWMFDEGTSTEVTDTYRKFVTLHHELVPYFLTHGTQALETGTSVMVPMEQRGTLIIENFDYRLGPDIFVAPMMTEKTVRTIKFPKGADQWVDWWDHSRVFEGGMTVDYDCPFDKFPVFHRAGSILPLHVTNALADHGDETSSEYLTLLVVRPGEQHKKREVRETSGPGLLVEYERTDKGNLEFSISAHPTVKCMLRLRCVAPPRAVHDLGTQTALVQHPDISTAHTHGMGWTVLPEAGGEVVILPGRGDRGVHLSLSF